MHDLEMGVSIQPGLTAYENTQALALVSAPLITSNSLHVFSTVAAGTGAALAPASLPARILVCNRSGEDLLVWPPIGGSINQTTINAPWTVPIDTVATFLPIGPGVLNWYTSG
jgi:hypothetical protein